MPKVSNSIKIGFIGQGWIGKNYADDFEARRYTVVRYALEEPYNKNQKAVGECDIVFIAVPTPTTRTGFDASYVKSALKNVGKGKTAIIKSTIVPGTTNMLQKEFPDIYVMHSPEFLTEATAAYDAAHPNRNIVGIPVEDDIYRAKAQEVLDVLPSAPFASIMRARDAEFVKYAGNCFLVTKVVYMNILYDMVTKGGGEWDKVRDALVRDPRIGTSHTQPVQDSWHRVVGSSSASKAPSKGRGAGGHCFIKDFEAFRRMYDEMTHDPVGAAFLEAMKNENVKLLRDSGKDLDILDAVYGKGK